MADDSPSSPRAWAQFFADKIQFEIDEIPKRGGAFDAEVLIAQAHEFLDRFADGSRFHQLANQPNYGGPVDEAINVVRALDGWIEYERTGLARELPYEARFRADAATDLMEQVQTLLDSTSANPAAAVMLAGAALEEVLRSMLVATDETISGHGTLDKYGAALKRAGAIERSDAKDVTALAGIRNDAAHGQFEKITLDRARLFVDQVNFLIMRLRPTS